MAQKQYDNSNTGALFTRQKKTQNSPDFGGDFELGQDVLDYVLRKAERGEPVKLEMSAWKRQGRNSTFLSMKFQIPYEERTMQQDTMPQRRPQQRGNGYATQRGREPIQTSRGQYDRSSPPARNVERPGTRENNRFREELNDQIPFGDDPAFETRDSSVNPWD